MTTPENTEAMRLSGLRSFLAGWKLSEGCIRNNMEATVEQWIGAIDALSQAEQRQEPAPIDMVLYCPKCGIQHIDAPDERTPDWTNPPHKSHLCHGCGHIWRPSDTPTNGVERTASGKDADTAPTPPPQPDPVRPGEVLTDECRIKNLNDLTSWLDGLGSKIHTYSLRGIALAAWEARSKLAKQPDPVRPGEVLTDEEAYTIGQEHWLPSTKIRAIEQAILSKLAKQEPVCETGFPGRKIFKWFRKVPQGTMLYAHPPTTPALLEAAEEAEKRLRSCYDALSGKSNAITRAHLVHDVAAMLVELRAAIEAHNHQRTEEKRDMLRDEYSVGFDSAPE